jgi:hypothetical protein
MKQAIIFKQVYWMSVIPEIENLPLGGTRAWDFLHMGWTCYVKRGRR